MTDLNPRIAHYENELAAMRAEENRRIVERYQDVYDDALFYRPDDPHAFIREHWEI